MTIQVIGLHVPASHGGQAKADTVLSRRSSMGKKNKQKHEATSVSNEQVPQTRVGIEIDGTEVHVAYVESTGHVSVQNFRDATSERALDLALKSIPSRAEIVRVAFTGGRQYVRRLQVPHVPERAMRAAMMAVAEENLPIVPGAASIAGLVVVHPEIDQEHNATPLDMVLAAVESDDLDPVWRKLGGRLAPITSSSFLLPADGLYLRVARATSEMIILKGGVPLLARTLRVGGLDDLERRVYSAQQAGDSPSFDGPSSNPDVGKSAAEITDLYIDELVNEFRKTLVFWKREGTDVPQDLIVLGVGATIPTLLTKIRDSGFNILTIPEPRGATLSIAEHEKPAAFQALVAAYSDFSRQPYAILPNPVYEAQKELAAKKSKQRAVALLSAAVIVGMLFVSIAPLAFAKARESVATQYKNRAEDNIKQYQAVIADNNQLKEGESAVALFETGVPGYTRIVCSVINSAPSGSTPTQFRSLNISSTESGANIDLSAQINDSSQGFQVIGDWQTRLEKTISSKSIGTGSFTFNPSSGTKDGSFRWTAPLISSFLVPNIPSCQGYEGGLSPEQLAKIANGYDPNDKTVTLDESGNLIDVATKKKVKSKAAVTTTTTTPTTSTTSTSVPETETSQPAEGGEQ